MDQKNDSIQLEKRYHCLAVASFASVITGLLSLPIIIFPFLGYVIWIAALILGIIAQFQINKNKTLYKGQWMSITAIILPIPVLLIANYIMYTYFPGYIILK